MRVVILEDAAADIEWGREFMKRENQESAITSSSRSSRILVHMISYIGDYIP